MTRNNYFAYLLTKVFFVLAVMLFALFLTAAVPALLTPTPAHAGVMAGGEVELAQMYEPAPTNYAWYDPRGWTIPSVGMDLFWWLRK